MLSVGEGGSKIIGINGNQAYGVLEQVEEKLNDLLIQKRDGLSLHITGNIDNFFDIILGKHHNDFLIYLEQNPLFSDIKDRFKIIAKKKLDFKILNNKTGPIIRSFFEKIINKQIIGELLIMFTTDINPYKKQIKIKNNLEKKDKRFRNSTDEDTIFTKQILEGLEKDIKELEYYKSKYEYKSKLKNLMNMLDEIGINDDVFAQLTDNNKFRQLVQEILEKEENKFLAYDMIFILIFIKFISTVYFHIISSFYEYMSKDQESQSAIYYKNFNDILKEDEHLGIGMFEYLDILEKFYYVLGNVLNYKKNIEFINTVLQPNTEEQRNDIYLTLSRDVNLYNKIEKLYNLQLMSRWKEFMEKGGKLTDYLDFVDINLFKEYPGIISFIDLDKIQDYEKFIEKSGLSNKEKAFAIEFGAIDKENDIIKKLLFIYENTELKKEQIKKLTDEQIVNIAENHNLPLEFLNMIIEGENINKVKKMAEIEAFKEDIFNKLYFIPETSGFNQITNQIKSELEKINIENFDETKMKITKLFDNNLKKIYDSIKKLLAKNILSLDEIKKLFNLLDTKKTKKNNLKNNYILDLLDYLLENFDKEEIDFIKNLLKNKQITSYFVENYQTMISFFVKNQNIIESIDDNGTTLKQLYENLQNKITEANVKNVIKTYFPESLEDEIYEYYQQNSENFDKLVTIAKKFENKEDELFYLELIAFENKEFKRFYFLIKNLSILGINLKDKYNKLLELLKNNLFSEEKLKELKDVLKGDILDYIDKDFFYTLFLNYIYEKENIDIFNVLMRPKEEEIVNEEFIKNKGLEGLAGINGSEALRKFQKLGYKEKRTSGSHYFMRHKETKQPLIFPYHEPIKASTLFGILNRAGIKKEDFLEK